MKKKTLLKITGIGLLGYGLLALIGSTLVSPVYTVSSEITLPANPELSWEVLTKFENYPEWNPYLTRVEGKLAPGETVSFTLIDGNFTDPMHLSAVVALVQPPKQFYWTGTLVLQGIHDTRHIFELKPRPDGTTQLLHYEEFRGVLPMLLPEREQRTAHTRRAFEGMNRALQQRLGK
ncbi:MAG: SRPBCC domain-containing protein [Halioglobus sp.]